MRLKWFYEASKIKQLTPLLILVGYSFVGGYLFHLLESDGESHLFEVRALLLTESGT